MGGSCRRARAWSVAPRLKVVHVPASSSWTKSTRERPWTANTSSKSAASCGALRGRHASSDYHAMRIARGKQMRSFAAVLTCGGSSSACRSFERMYQMWQQLIVQKSAFHRMGSQSGTPTG